MRIMAVGARELAFDDGVVRRLEQLRTDLFVAGSASFILQLAHGGLVRADGRIGFFQRYSRAGPGRAMQGVAVVARNVVLFVLA